MTHKKQLSTIIDYIDWRGDLSFSISPLNEIDALIFCQLSYMNFSNLIPETFDSSIKLSELSKIFFGSSDFETRSDLGMLIDKRTNGLLKKCGQSNRFKDVEVTGFVSEYSREIEKQFSAVSFIINSSSILEKQTVFTAFRGTDDTIIGWKEDFNLAFMDEVPAQKEALNYLENAAASFKKAELFTGGHSKGGNLAVFAAANLCDKAKNRLRLVYNFDGPGFSQEVLDSDSFFSVKAKICSVYPQFSIVGMLFHHYDSYKTVLSSEKLLMQHNPFSWFVKGTDFEQKEELDSGSEIFFTSFNKWFESLLPSQREQFVETVFGLLDSTDAVTNSDLKGDALKNTGKILKAFATLDSAIRDEAVKIVLDFIKTVVSESIKFQN
ncbi:Mbeg1-like protein [Treponema sp.]|uniref:Mbeg1-like protein n=1 Tax=Treponema sp. TaxID=166 RepID=UPI00388D08AF